MPVEEFKLRAIFEAEDRLSDGLRRIRKGVDELAEGTEAGGRRMEGTFVRVRDVALGVLGGLFGFELLRVVRDFVEGSAREFMELERDLVRLAVVSRQSGQDVHRLAGAFYAVAGAAAREFAVSAREAAGALEALVKAGLSAEDAIGALGSVIMLARTEGVDFATAGNSVVQVLAQFGLRGDEARRAVDALVNASSAGIGTAIDFAQGLANAGATARALGLSLEDATAWLVILERRLGSAHEAGTHLNRFLLDLYEIAEKLGVPIRDASGALRDANDVILDVIAAAKGLSGDFAALQDKLRGVDMRALRALFTFTQMTENFGELRDQIARSGTAFEAFSSVMETTAGKAERMRSEVDAMMRRIGDSASEIGVMLGSVVLPAVDFFFSSFESMVGKATGNAKAWLEGYLNTQIILGRITREEAAEMIAAYVRLGEITEREALEMAGNILDLSSVTKTSLREIVMAAIETGAEVPPEFETLRLAMEQVEEKAPPTADAVLDVARAFGITGERAVELARKVLGLDLTYDEHGKAIKKLMEAYGITEEQAREFIAVLEQERQAQKQAKQSVDAHTLALEGLRNRLEEVRASAQAVSVAQNAVNIAMGIFSAQVAIMRGMIVDEVQMIRLEIMALEEQEQKLRESGKATQEQIDAIRQRRQALEQELQAIERSAQLTAEQVATQERLAAIQQVLSLTSQILAFQQTALQLAMMGATGAADMYLNVSLGLTQALEDGIITKDEYIQILRQLGVTFDEQGRPVFNFRDIMEELRRKILETQNQIENFRNSLRSLDGTTVHTYHYHHEIIVREEQSGGGDGGGGANDEEPFGDRGPTPAQRGAWYTHEGLYYLHRGEMVLPRDVAEWFRRTGPVQNIAVRITVNASGTASPDEIAEMVSRELVRRLRMIAA